VLLPQQGVLQREGAARPALVCFNLGWMPGQPDGCKEIKTETGTTVEALRQAHEAVADGGSVSVVAYTGHEGTWWSCALALRTS
jgi:threonine dehydrogenase-like Zn-dependent dehydrogenase